MRASVGASERADLAGLGVLVAIPGAILAHHAQELLLGRARTRLTGIAALVPAVLAAGWARRTLSRHLDETVAVRAVRASRHQVQIDDIAPQGEPVWGARYENGSMILSGRFWVSRIRIDVSPDTASDIASALQARVVGLNTILVRSPVHDIAIVGALSAYVAPLITIFAALVLFAATPGATPAAVFACILVSSLLVWALSWNARVMVIAADALIVSSRFGGLERMRWEAIEKVEVVGRVVAVSRRSGETRRYPLCGSPFATSLHEAYRASAEEAQLPAQRATSRAIAARFA